MTLVKIWLPVFIAARRRNARAAIHLWAEAIKRTSYRRIYIKQYGLVEKALSRIVSEGVKRGELRKEINPDTFAAYLLALISGLQVQLVLNEALDLDRYSEDIAAFVLDRLWNKDET